MTIDAPQARYRQLAAMLREAIERGDYAPGSALESESALAARYSVDRRTVNRAVLTLRAEGLVRVVRGRGTIVRELPVICREAVTRQHIREAAGARGAFQAELERLGLAPRSDVEVMSEDAPADVAELLGLEASAKVIVRHRQMFAGDVPVQLATSYLPADLAAGTPMAERDSGPGGIYSRLADAGHAPAELTETVRVRPPADREARFLRMDAEQRVISIRRIARDHAGRAVEVNDIAMAAHQWELVYRWPIGAPDPR